ncbi:hypothetical protein VMT65_31520 [Nocardia sp. CDC153]|uniref:DUF6630 family protein n=1 Tax=Nocardia sp. CDC153 TaxID=3112167 RepID=UPI002DC019F1|nr:hypothetical protein [Nocardia sp. CDC153]MEC3957600.1 hypothetical protein [Nocardia sp. CDC153]
MEFDNREAWAKVAQCLVPGYPQVARAVRSGTEDPFDEMRSALDNLGQSAYIDWKSDPDDIRRDLKAIQKFPHKFRWSWYPAFIATLQNCDSGEDTVAALEEIGERCLEIKHALLSLEIDADGYALTAIHIDRLPFLLDLTAEAGRRFRVIRRGCWES